MRLLMALVALSLLVACAQQAPDTTFTPSPPAPGNQEMPVVVDDEQPPQLSQPTVPVVEAPSKNCVSAELIQASCGTEPLPVLREQCVFDVPRNGKPSGEINVSIMEGATLDDYLAAIKTVKYDEETYELKPRSLRAEAQPFSYFFWFDGSRLYIVQAHQWICNTEGMKKLLLSIAEE